MNNRYHRIFVLFSLFLIAAGTACSQKSTPTPPNQISAVPSSTPPMTVIAAPAQNLTPADVAKLKWIEGMWRGMDGEKPFFERYRLEGTTLVVETFTDETLAKIEDTSKFELKDGEFGTSDGARRSAATSITADAVQFVPVTGGGNSFRFERKEGGTWNAVLEWPAKEGKPAGSKTYNMQPYSPKPH